MRFPVGRLFAGMTLLLAACVAGTPQPPPPADPAFAALGIHRIAVAPVVYATYQSGERCSTFIDEEFRSALVRELQRRGYAAAAAGTSVPRSFGPGSPPPLPGDPPPAGPLPSSGDAQGVLQVWIEEYWENTLCTWEGPKYLTMGAVGVLYAGSPPAEVWRGRARVAEQGDYSASDLMWLATTRLSEGVLRGLPAASEGVERR